MAVMIAAARPGMVPAVRVWWEGGVQWVWFWYSKSYQPSPLIPIASLHAYQAAAREAIALLDNPALVGESRLPEDTLALRQQTQTLPPAASAAAPSLGGGLATPAGVAGAGSTAAAAVAASGAASGIYMGQ